MQFRLQWNLLFYLHRDIVAVYGRACEEQELKSHDAFVVFSVRFINLIVPCFPRPNELRLPVMSLRWSSMPATHFHGTTREEEERENKMNFHIVRSFAKQYVEIDNSLRRIRMSHEIKSQDLLSPRLYKNECFCSDGGSHMRFKHRTKLHPMHTYITGEPLNLERKRLASA